MGDLSLSTRSGPAWWRIVVSMFLLLIVIPATLLLGARWDRPDLGIAPRARPWTVRDIAVLAAAALITGSILTWLIRDTGKMLIDAFTIDKAKRPQQPEWPPIRTLVLLAGSISIIVGSTVLLNATWSFSGFQPGLALLAVQKGIFVMIVLIMPVRLQLSSHVAGKPARPRELRDAQLDEV